MVELFENGGIKTDAKDEFEFTDQLDAKLAPSEWRAHLPAIVGIINYLRGHEPSEIHGWRETDRLAELTGMANRGLSVRIENNMIVSGGIVSANENN